MKKIVLGISAAALVFTGAAALAHEHPMPADPMGGKTVTRAEVLAKASEMFDKLDLNHDGKLDTADRAAGQAALFDRLDTDHNGSLSSGEFAAGHGHPPLGGDGMPGDPPAMRMMATMLVHQAAKNGVTTKEDFLAAAGRHFDMADANHDGKITPEERKAAHARMRAMMSRMHGGRGGHGDHGGPGGMDMPPPPPPPPSPPGN